MKIEIWATSTFTRQLKKLKKANYPVHLITVCLKYILQGNQDKKRIIKDHQLSGQWRDYREFHPARISNYSGSKYDQWIVIYKKPSSKVKLILVATGNHSILHKLKPKRTVRNAKQLKS